MVVKGSNKFPRQFRPMHFTVDVMNNVIPVIKGTLIICCAYAVVGEQVIVAGTVLVNEYVLTPVCVVQE